MWLFGPPGAIFENNIGFMGLFGPPGAIFENNISFMWLFGPPGAIFEKKQQPAKPRRTFFDFRKWL